MLNMCSVQLQLNTRRNKHVYGEEEVSFVLETSNEVDLEFQPSEIKKT